MRTSLINMAFAVLLLTACVQDPESSTDVEADSLAVLELVNRIQETAGAGNFDAYFDLYTDDAVWMFPDDFEDVGKEGARDAYGFVERYTFDQETTINEIQVMGDWAFARLSFDGYIRPRPNIDAEPVRAISRHLVLMQRQPDGSWKFARDIFNNPPEAND